MQPVTAAQPLRGRTSVEPELAISQAELEQIGRAAGRHGVRTMRDGSNIEVTTPEDAADAIAIDPSLEGEELVTVTDPETGDRAVVAVSTGEPAEPEPEVRQQRPRVQPVEEEEPEARFIKPVDRGTPKAAPKMQAGTRVQLTDEDMGELKAIAYDLDRSLGRKLSNVRDPSPDERAIARAHRPFFIRESERRERIVVMEEEGKNPLIVSLAEKPALWPNVLSAGMHAVGALPLVGAVAHAPGGGIIQGLAGLGAIATGLIWKNENSLQLIRTGVKHALWGTVNTVLDGMGLYPLRMLATGAGVALDMANIVASRKQRPVQVIEAKQPPSFLQRIGAGLDYIANGILNLFKR